MGRGHEPVGSDGRRGDDERGKGERHGHTMDGGAVGGVGSMAFYPMASPETPGTESSPIAPCRIDSVSKREVPEFSGTKHERLHTVPECGDATLDRYTPLVDMERDLRYA